MAALSPQTLHVNPTDLPTIQQVGPYIFVSVDGSVEGPQMCFLTVQAYETWLDTAVQDLQLHKAQLRLDLGDVASDAVIYGVLDGAA